MIEENKQIAPVAEGKISALIDPKKHNLTAIHKEVDKHVKEAMQYLASVLRDEKASIDQKIKASEKLTEFKLKVADAQNKEFLQRLILQSKLELGIGVKKIKEVEAEDEDSEEDDTPMYTPDVILEVNNVKNM